jgi:hypothetical protein
MVGHYQRAPIFGPWRAIMKAYLITTGTIFGLITVAHIWRIVAESPHLAKDPWFMLLTILTAALCLWAFRLLRRAAS